jgi:hypothetical protein
MLDQPPTKRYLPVLHRIVARELFCSHCQPGRDVARFQKSGGGGRIVEAGSFELCFAFLLGASVGYALRAAISRVRRANVRKRRREEFARLHAREHSDHPGRQPAEGQAVAEVVNA